MYFAGSRLAVRVPFGAVKSKFLFSPCVFLECETGRPLSIVPHSRESHPLPLLPFCYLQFHRQTSLGEVTAAERFNLSGRLNSEVGSSCSVVCG